MKDQKKNGNQGEKDNNSNRNTGHDQFVKKAMSRPRVAREFLESYLPKELMEIIDLNTLKQENTRFLSNILQEGIVDLLYSVKHNDGKEAYISILIEHQTMPDKYMTFRIQKYMLRICDEHLRKNKGGELPLVYPLIYYAGRVKYNAPRSFYELFSDKELAKKFYTEPVKVVDLQEIEDEELREKSYSGVMMYVMKHIYENEILPYIEAGKKLIEVIAQEDLDYLEDMLYYIIEKAESAESEKVLDALKEITVENRTKDMATIKEFLLDKGRQEGLAMAEQLKVEAMEKGVEKGRLEGESLGTRKGKIEGQLEAKINVARKMLSEGFDISMISKFTELSEEEIVGLKNR